VAPAMFFEISAISIEYDLFYTIIPGCMPEINKNNTHLTSPEPFFVKSVKTLLPILKKFL
jgi:hypothetical protein